MRIRYKADVESHVKFSKNKEFFLDDFTVKLHFSDGFLSEIVLERELSEVEIDNFTNKMESFPENDGEIDHKITISGIEHIQHSAKKNLQLIESFFGLFGVSSIDWRNAEREFIPDSEEERSKFEVGSYKFDWEYKRDPKKWNFSFQNIDWETISQLKIPLSFHRKALVYHQNFDYVEAYSNLYFIIEGFYSNGEHQRVEKEYLKSNELMNYVSDCLPHILSEKGQELNPFFSFYQKERTPEGFVRLITVLRHHLHHYFHQSTNHPSPNPFQVEDIQPLSYSLLYLTRVILIEKTNFLDN